MEKTPYSVEIGVKRKFFTSDFVNNKSRLVLFFKKIGNDRGPYTKSMFISHHDLIKKCKQIGVTINKDAGSSHYYIVMNPYEDKNYDHDKVLDVVSGVTEETILFDHKFLDLDFNHGKETDDKQ